MQLNQTNHRRHLCCTHEYKRRPLLLLRVSDANGKWSICILGWPCLQPLGSASEVSAVNIPPTHTALDSSFMYPMLISTDDTYTRASDKLLGYTRDLCSESDRTVWPGKPTGGGSMRNMRGSKKSTRGSSPAFDCVFAQWLWFRSADIWYHGPGSEWQTTTDKKSSY